MTRPGLARDAAVINRPVVTEDSEGGATGTLELVADVFGTWGTPSGTDRQVAGARGVILDAVLAVANGVDVQVADLVTVRDAIWEVTAVVDVRLHQRVFLRRAH